MKDRYSITLELLYHPEPEDQQSMADTCEAAMLHLLRDLNAESPAITASEDSNSVWVSLLLPAQSPGAALDEAEGLIRTAFHVVGVKTPGWELRSGGFDAGWDDPTQRPNGGKLTPA